MLNKKKVLFVILIFLVGNVLAIEINQTTIPTIYVSGGPNLQISSLKYEPYPLEPGELFNLWVKLENRGLKETQNAICNLILEYPFFLDENWTATKEIGQISPFDQVVLEFKNIRVDSNAQEGENELKLKCWVDKYSQPVENSFTITIRSRFPKCIIRDVRTNPEFIQPGGEAEIILSLENDGNSTMRDVQVELDFSSVPLIPSREIGVKLLKNIEKGSVKNVSFYVRALPDAVGGVYRLPVLISYFGMTENQHSLNGSISIEINSYPEIQIIADTPDLLTTKKTGELVLRIINKGLTDIKYLSITLMNNKDIKVLSGNTVYIGDVDSDDIESAEFRVKLSKSKLVLPVQIEYRDVVNRKYTQQMNISFELLSPIEAGKGNSLLWIIAVGILFLLIFLIYKRKEKVIKLFKK